MPRTSKATIQAVLEHMCRVYGWDHTQFVLHYYSVGGGYRIEGKNGSDPFGLERYSGPQLMSRMHYAIAVKRWEMDHPMAQTSGPVKPASMLDAAVIATIKRLVRYVVEHNIDLYRIGLTTEDFRTIRQWVGPV